MRQFIGLPYIFLLALLSCPLTSLNAQELDTLRYQAFVEDIFSSNETLDVTLRSNYRNLKKKRYKEEYQPAFITFHLSNGDTLGAEVRIRSRGLTRKKICTQPPVHLSFKKSVFTPRDTSSYMDKLKLVTACRNAEQYENYLLNEYLIYKMYELVSEYSLRTRLMKINYIDTHKGKNKSNEVYSFLIEDIDHLAYRKECMEIETNIGHQDNTRKQHMNVLAIFQFMIGNTDWSVPAMHNVKLIKPLDFNLMEPIAIPYDFDYAGLVNADYAVPDDRLGIESVRQRVFRGFCRSEEEINAAISVFEQLKPEFFDLINTIPYYDNGYKEQTIEYLEDFYDIINDPRRVRSYFIDGCRTE